MTFIPLIIQGIYILLREENLYNKKQKFLYNKANIIIIIGLTGIIQTHILSIEMVGIFVILTGICYIYKFKNLKRIFSLIKIIFITLIINLWFIIPFIDYMGEDIIITELNMNSNALIQRHGLFINQLFSPFTNILGISKPISDGIIGDFGLSLGAALSFGFITFCYFFIIEKNKTKEELGIFLLGILAILLTTVYFPFDILSDTFLRKIIVNLQFPWRFLTIGVILAVIATGYVITKYLNNKSLVMVLVVLGILNASFAIKEISFETRDYLFDNYLKVYDGRIMNIGTIGGEYLPIGTNIENLEDILKYQNLDIVYYEKKGTYTCISYKNNSSNNNSITLPLLNYKGFIVNSLDGQDYILINSENNQIEIILPNSESGKFEVLFKEPISWRICELISLIGVILFILYIIIIVRIHYMNRGEIENE